VDSTTPFKQRVWGCLTIKCRLSGHVFGSFWHPLHNGATRVPETHLVWRRQPFCLFLLLFSLSLLLKFCAILYKISYHPLQFLLPSHLVCILLIAIFFYFRISFIIINIFQFHPNIFQSISIKLQIFFQFRPHHFLIYKLLMFFNFTPLWFF